MFVRFIVRPAAGKVEDLKDLEPVFRPEPVISQDRVKEIKFLRIYRVIMRIGEQRRDRPLRLIFCLLGIVERPDHLGPLSWLKGQPEVTISGARDDISVELRAGLHCKQQR